MKTDSSSRFTALSIFTDILLASLPIPVIWKLQLKTKIRVYLIIMLALGWGAVGIGIVKGINQIQYDPLGDSTYEIGVPTWALYVSLPEMALSIRSGMC